MAWSNRVAWSRKVVRRRDSAAARHLWKKEAERLSVLARELLGELEADRDVLAETRAVEHARLVVEELEAWMKGRNDE